MPISVTCPRCQRQMRLADAAAGKKAKCAGCGNIVVVPDAPAGPVPPVGPQTAPSSPPCPAPPPPRRQVVLRIITFLFVLLGTAGTGFLGATWLGQYQEQAATIKQAEDMLQFGKAVGMDTNSAETAISQLSKLLVTAYLLTALAGLGLLWGLWLTVSRARGFLPGLMMLAGVAAAGILEPKTLIFTGFLILGGLLCLFIRGAKRSIVSNLLTGSLTLGFLAVPLLAQYQPELLGIQPTRTSLATGRSLGPLDTLGQSKEISTVPPPGKEKLHGDGFASPEEAMDLFVKSVLTLDVDSYKKWLGGAPEDVSRFDRMVEAEVKEGKKTRKFTEKQMIEMVRDEWIKGRSKKSPAISDSEDDASIVLLSKPLGTNNDDPVYKRYSFKKSNGRWFRIGESAGNLGELKAPYQVLPDQLRDVIPADATLPVLDYTAVIVKVVENFPKDAEAARRLLKKKFEKAKFDGNGNLVTLGSNFTFITDVAVYKAVVLVLSPAFKDKELSFLVAAYFSDADLEKLAGLTALEKLDITGPTHITDKGMASLKGLTNLKKLGLESPYVTDVGLAHLQGMKNLEELKLRVRITDAGLAHLAGMTGLKELELQGGYVAGPGLVHLKGCAGLDKLKLNANSLTSRSLDHLAAVPKVKSLSLMNNYIDDAGLAALPKALPALDSLSLDGNQISDQGLESLAQLPKLKDLSLMWNRITGPGLVHIKNIAKAEGIFKGSLDVRKNPLTDLAVDYLSALERTGSVRLEVDREVRTKIEERQKTADHIGDVFAVALAPDGKPAATGGTDKTIKLWDVATGRPRNTLRAHSSAVRVVAFSPDGKILASGGLDSNAYLWDPNAPDKPRSLSEQRSVVYSLSFTADGKQLATAGGMFAAEKGEIKIWDTASARELKTIAYDTHILCVVLAPDGKWAASGGTEKFIRLWDTASGKETGVLKGHADSVSALAVTADGKTLVSAGKDRTIKLWDVASAKETATLRGHEGEISSVALAADGKTLVSGSKDKTVRLWDLPTGKETATITDFPGEVITVAIASDGKTVAAAGRSKAPKLWYTAAARKAFAPSAQGSDPIAAIKKLKGQIEFDPDGDPKVPVSASLLSNMVYDNDLAKLKGFTHLRKLAIGSNKVTDAGLAHLAGLSELEELTLGVVFGKGPQITDAGLAHLKGLTRLRKLNLGASGITGAGLEHLKGAADLGDLDLMSCKMLTDAGLASLKHFPNLESLNLYEAPITGTGLANLKKTTRLKYLNLNDAANFTDAGLENLGALTNLEGLSLNKTKVTDAGLLHLKKLTKLEGITLKDTKVTDKGIKALKAALPKLNVER